MLDDWYYTKSGKFILFKSFHYDYYCILDNKI